jgi:hypothetical protein
LETVLEAREEHVGWLEDNGFLDQLPDDWECLILGSSMSDGPVGQMHSWSTGRSYEALDHGNRFVLATQSITQPGGSYASRHQSFYVLFY